MLHDLLFDISTAKILVTFSHFLLIEGQIRNILDYLEIHVPSAVLTELGKIATI